MATAHTYDVVSTEDPAKEKHAWDKVKLPMLLVKGDQPDENKPAESGKPTERKEVVDIWKRLADDGLARKRWRASIGMKKVWHELTQSTTLVGVNKITETTPFTIRRYIWGLIVLGGFIACIYQLTCCIIYYRSRPVTVNVLMHHNSSVVFPAVTLCNLNTYRMTPMVDLGLYNMFEYLNKTDPFKEATVDVAHYKVDTLMSTAAHRREDMIVSCYWNGEYCSWRDFKPVFTDHGLCYMFNGPDEDGAHNGDYPRSVSNAGSGSGLKLMVNIEQYEYMRGPHAGAGLKVLIHDQKETPLVKDLGDAVAPGTYSFIGITTGVESNLQPPYGHCDDRVALQFSDTYAISACMVECREQHMLSVCACREPSMPVSSTGYPPVCTLQEFVGCYLSVKRTFHKLSSVCDCPIPCRRVHYQSGFSQASASNFDMRNLFLGTTARRLHRLRTQYVHALETAQRANKLIRDDNQRLFKSFTKSASQVVDLFDRLKMTTYLLKQRVDESYAELQRRISFHNRYGLSSLVKVTQYNFIRGWMVADERTFTFVSTNYYEISYAIRKTLRDLRNDSFSDNTSRLLIYGISKRQLQDKRVIATKALSNITTIQNAYLNCTPLLTYDISPLKFYDNEYITQHLIRRGTYYITEYYAKFQLRLTQLLENIAILDKMLDDAYAKVNNSHGIDAVADKFEFAARSFNYYRFLYKARVVDLPEKTAKDMQKRFQDVTIRLRRQQNELQIVLSDFLTRIHDADESLKGTIVMTSQTTNFLHNAIANKTSIAQMFISPRTVEGMRSLHIFFSHLVSQSRQINSLLASNRAAYQAVWEKMLSEKALQPFYERLAEDIRKLQSNESGAHTKRIVVVLSKMLYINETHLRNNVQHLPEWTNADFNHTLIETKKAEIGTFFRAIRHLIDVKYALEIEDQFVINYNALNRDLTKFIELSRIDEEFYKQNFLQLDIYLKELSYQEMQQRIAYDQFNLWSDIGGSTGLFLGASIVTVFEIIDIIVHNLSKLYCYSLPSTTRV